MIEKQQQPSEYGDVYDVIKEVIDVHTQRVDITKDHIVSNLSKDELYFLIRHFRVVNMIQNFLSDAEVRNKIKNLKRPKYEDKRQLERDMEHLTMVRVNITKSLLNDTTTLALVSRAREGKILKSIIDGMVKRKPPEETENMGILQKLGFKKPKNDENQ